MELTLTMTDKTQAITSIKTIRAIFKLDTKIDFEGYLMDKHAEQYEGWKSHIGQNMVDDLAKWLGDLEVEDFIKYGNQYAEKMRLK